MNILPIVGAGWLIAAAGMALLWLAVGRRNAGVVDVAWSFATGLLGVWFALNAGGWAPRQGLVAALAGIGGVRRDWHRRPVGLADHRRARADVLLHHPRHRHPAH